MEKKEKTAEAAAPADKTADGIVVKTEMALLHAFRWIRFAGI